eukprot:TRINITY_DN15539_c0_g4_i1.p1 TRINITY_DN15539_c0_g4~~TRINITY_DN15539_c0_g4_i1.p1  ORF type:complete len:141 (-),score=38.99 TRINITY_DN15539_c0_g4_i1:56-478(-)
MCIRDSVNSCVGLLRLSSQDDGDDGGSQQVNSSPSPQASSPMFTSPVDQHQQRSPIPVNRVTANASSFSPQHHHHNTPPSTATFSPVLFQLEASLALVLHCCGSDDDCVITVSYTHLRAHETPEHLVCRLLLEKKKKRKE